MMEATGNALDIISMVLCMLGFGGIVSGVVTVIIRRNFDRMDKKAEERSQTRIAENMLMMEGISSIGKLAYATAIAKRDGKINGEMTSAMEAYVEYQKSESCFQRKQTAQQIHGAQ